MLRRPAYVFGAIAVAMTLIVIAIATAPRAPAPAPIDVGAAVVPPVQPRLVDESLARGIFYTHVQLSDAITGLDESLGSGACAFDMDNDRDMDLYLVGGSGHHRYYGKPSWWSQQRTGRLYRNRGDGYFDDVTAASGLATTFWGMGCSVADFDLDGYVDLLVTGRNGNSLWRNRDGKSFEPVEFDAAGAWTTSAAIGDYDADGRMDIYLANYLVYDNTAHRFEALSGYQTEHAEFQSQNFPAQANRLYVNRGAFTFSEAADRLGVGNSDGRTLGARWFDVNRDRRLDLLVMNDSGSTTRLYLREPGAGFALAPAGSRLELPGGARGGALQDFDGDGDADLVLSTRLGEDAVLLAARDGAFDNVLRQNHRDGNRFAGLSGFGVQFVDLNNDGEFDIYHANGLAVPDSDAPAVSAGQPDLVSLGDGRGNFEAAASGIDADWNPPLSSRAVIGVDVDNDGDKDLLVTANNNPARLLINHSPLAAWIGFDLTDRHGNPGNFDRLVLATNRRRKTFFADDDTLLGRHDHRVTQALRAGEEVVEVEIHWRDGEPKVVAQPAANVYHVIRQNDPRTGHYRPLARRPAPVPPRLALWQIRSGRAARESTLASFAVADSTLRGEMLAAIGAHDTGLELLAVVRTALADADVDVVLAAIELLTRLELEASHYWLAALFARDDPRILCALAGTYRHFYIEEEAMILRKALAVPHLLRLLEHDQPGVVACATLALAESKSYRAVVPIERLLLGRDDAGILRAAVYALGELRRTRSVEAILALATDDTELRRARARALAQLTVGERDNFSSIADPDSPAPGDPAARCPAQSPAAVAALAPAAQAAALDACPAAARAAWFARHADALAPHAGALLGNEHLAAETHIALVDALARVPGLDLTRTLVERLHRHRGIDEDIALARALRQRLPRPGIEKLLKRLLEDRTLSTEARLAAGDVLIEIDPDHVMSFAHELFDEKPATAAD